MHKRTSDFISSSFTILGNIENKYSPSSIPPSRLLHCVLSVEQSQCDRTFGSQVEDSFSFPKAILFSRVHVARAQSLTCVARLFQKTAQFYRVLEAYSEPISATPIRTEALAAIKNRMFDVAFCFLFLPRFSISDILYIRYKRNFSMTICMTEFSGQVRFVIKCPTWLLSRAIG